MIKANYHTHTNLCDGTDTPEDVAAFAVESGLSHLGFSGHMDPDIHMDWPSYLARINGLRAAYAGRIDILAGVELDNCYDPACCPDAEYVIGSTHFLPDETPVPMSVDNSPQILRELCEDCYGGDYYALARAYYSFEALVHDRTNCTFVGHFDLITRFNDQMHFLDEKDPAYLRPALNAMEYLVGQGVPFEINCGAVNRGRKRELYPNNDLLRALHDFGGQIILSADAHQKELLLGGFDIAVDRAIRCGFTHTNILEHDSFGNVVFRQVALDTL